MTELLYNVRDIFSADSQTGCLPQSGCNAFWIPAYQRGYKWGADGETESSQPVDQLLNDLEQAWRKNATEYLLQAITVKKVREGGGWVLEVIDGQQRLTTLFILLLALDRRLGRESTRNIATAKLHYSIRHSGTSLDVLVENWLPKEALTGSFAACKASRKVDQENHQDHYYLHSAALRCLYHFRPKESRFKQDEEVERFQDYLLNNVKLLVNRVEPHVEGEVIFANLNSNRVPLTECELIKGVLLTRVARGSGGQSHRYREILERRIQLGRQWDDIIQWVNRKEIKSFYFSATQAEPEDWGMMQMLELAARLVPMNAYKPKASTAKKGRPLFTYMFESDDPPAVFSLLAETFSRLRDWYEDDTTYHLLGYCLTGQVGSNRVIFLVNCLRFETKSVFRRELLNLRRQMLCREAEVVDIDKLSYGEHSPQLQNILLALSVFSEGLDSRFNFHAYAEDGWSLEHIFPQAPFGKGASLKESQREAALDILTSSDELLGDSIVQEIAQLRNSESNDLKVQIEEVLRRVPILHKIGNLCLLRNNENTALGCRMFGDKRRVIRERIAKGSFVPRHTYEVFSKMIVGGDDNLDVWSKIDIEEHAKVIKQRVEKLIQETA